jgi:chromosome segregation ATPase
MKACLLLLSVFTLAAVAAWGAETAETSDARLREALRSATLQLRTAETERANLQSAQTTLLEEKKVISEKFEVLRKQTVLDRAADEKAIASLKTQVSAQQDELARLKEALAKSEASHQQAAALAVGKEGERAQLAAQITRLEQKLADREIKNLALFKIGNEILTRYEKFSLGDALAAREPFVGATRTRLENLVQDYEDKLTQQRAKP